MLNKLTRAVTRRAIHLYFALCVAATVLFPACGISHKDASPEREVISAVERLSAAGLRRDIGVLNQIYSEDYFHTNPDGSIMTRSEVFASYQVPTIFRFDSSTASALRVVVRGTFAIVNEVLALHGEKQGSGKFTSRYRVTYILEKQHGEWKVLNSHSSLIAIEAER